MIVSNLFTSYIYQPFFNILVGIYWFISRIGFEPDMGFAVIIFALVIRIIMLPLTLAGDQSETEKQAIIAKIKHLKKEFASNPIRFREEQKKIFKNNPAALVSESITILIQIVIALMLYRIFKTGLEGSDFHLLYDFMPSIPQPINLIFLGRFNLSYPSPTLNLIQSLAIFIYESLHMLLSPQPTSRREFISMGLLMPTISYIIFSFLPSGKKLFIITTIFFSINLLLVKQLLFWYHTYLSPSKKQG